jgi:hypothetical protein
MKLTKNIKIGLIIFLIVLIITVVTLIVLSVKKSSSSQGDDAKPDDSGDDAKPDDSGDDAKPDDSGDDAKPDDSGDDTSSNIRPGKYTLSIAEWIKNKKYDRLIKQKVPTEFTIVKDENGKKVVYSSMAGADVTFDSPSNMKVNGMRVKATDPSRVTYNAIDKVSGYGYSYTVEDLPEGTISPSNIRPGKYTLSIAEWIKNKKYDALITARNHANMPREITIEYDENDNMIVYGGDDNLPVTFDGSIMTLRGRRLMATGVPIVRYNAIDKVSGYSFSYDVSQT